MYTNLFFDFDGTLYDTVEGITKCVRYALRKRGMDAPLEELRCFAGPPLTDMFMEKYGFSREEGDRATRDFRERYVPIGLYESRPFPGMRELLQELRGAGKRLAVTTSKPQILAEELLRREGMFELFDVVCGAADEGEDNEKWRILRRAMERMGAEKETSVLIGDTKYDVAGARRCAIPCIGVGYGYAAPGELEEAGAELLAPDLAALRAILLD